MQTEKSRLLKEFLYSVSVGYNTVIWVADYIQDCIPSNGQEINVVF